MKKHLNKVYKAIKTYSMISAGDKVAVGISGGKDSLFLLDLLLAYQKTCGFDFDIVGITVDMGFENSNFEPLKNFMKERNVEYKIIPSSIKEVVFDVRKEKNPCSLCAKLRRGILCSSAKELGCNKLALGHHTDDVVETFFLSLIFEGRISSFAPISYMSNTQITVIRPMILFNESEVISATQDYPIFKNPCPADKNSKRKEVKDFLTSLETLHKDAKKHVLRAIQNPERTNLWNKEK